MRVPALIARAFIVVFALASGLAGAAAAANIHDSAGGRALVADETLRSGDDMLVAGTDRDRDRKAKLMERTGQVLADEEDVDTADTDADAEETAPTEETVDTETADTDTDTTDDEEASPTPTPTARPTASPTASPAASPTRTPRPTATPKQDTGDTEDED